MTDLFLAEAAQGSAAPSAAVSRSSAAVFGEVAWLMMESPWHRGRTTEDFHRLVMPPIKLRQFRIFHEGTKPIAFVSWAFLSPDAEQRYLDNHHQLAATDWSGGQNAYIVDLVVSNLRFRKLLPYLRQDPLLSATRVRGLKMRNSKRFLLDLFVDAQGTHIRARSIA